MSVSFWKRRMVHSFQLGIIQLNQNCLWNINTNSVYAYQLGMIFPFILLHSIDMTE